MIYYQSVNHLIAASISVFNAELELVPYQYASTVMAMASNRPSTRPTTSSLVPFGESASDPEQTSAQRGLNEGNLVSYQGQDFRVIHLKRLTHHT